MSDAPVLRLNPALDPAAFAPTYAREGLVRIPDVFEPAVVDRLAGILEQTIDWDVICSNESGGAETLSRARRAELGADAVAARLHAATLRARTGFAYIYLGYPMIDAFVEGRDPGHPIHALTAFLNSPEFIAFGAAVTLEKVLTEVDLQPDLAVVTTGEDDQFPPDLLIGWIGKTGAKEASSVYQKAEVVPAASPAELTTVFIIE